MIDDPVTSKLAKLADDLADDMQGALEAAAEKVLARANETVPVDSGDLQDSGNTGTDGDRVVIEYTEEYADVVHEAPGSSGYKWLEKAALDPQTKQEVADEADQRVRSTVG